jgi:RHS repeat-associated protein
MEPNVDFMRYRDTAGTDLGSDTGARGWAWSGWMTPAPADRKVNLVLQSNATNESAVNTQWCEYRASDAAVASPFWIPLRFPGQYWDRESDYFENWNRYYDPWTGRYLQPEPLMARPDLTRRYARMGRPMLAYAYANGNPVRVVDINGEATVVLCEFTLRDPDPDLPKKGSTVLEPATGINCGGENGAELSISISIAKCYTVLKGGPGDPLFALPPRPTTYDEVKTHEHGHVDDMNDCVNMWVGRHVGDEGDYCTRDACLKKVAQLETDFDLVWADCVIRTQCRWGDRVCD